MFADNEVQVDVTGCLYRCIPFPVEVGCFAPWKISASVQDSHKADSGKEGRKSDSLSEKESTEKGLGLLFCTVSGAPLYLPITA